MSKTSKTYNIHLEKGHKLNDYTIYKKLSSGGFSIVYLAYHKDGTPVAIKEFFPNDLYLRNKGSRIDFVNMREKLKFQEGLKAFKLEMEIIMKMKHKNIIEIINFFEMNGTAYIIMPYEYGMTLSKYISIDDPSDYDISYIISGVFSAVNTLHENNIIHLDLKPGNIWLRPNKDALILDFGTARIVSDEKNKNPPMHTPGYAAPEQHKAYFHPSRIGFWTDYYALGATLYALIEKNVPEQSCDLMDKGIMVQFVSQRRGQYNETMMRMAELLMTLDWHERKKISLIDIILKINKIKPINNVENIIEIM